MKIWNDSFEKSWLNDTYFYPDYWCLQWTTIFSFFLIFLGNDFFYPPPSSYQTLSITCVKKLIERDIFFSRLMMSGMNDNFFLVFSYFLRTRFFLPSTLILPDTEHHMCQKIINITQNTWFPSKAKAEISLKFEISRARKLKQ